MRQPNEIKSFLRARTPEGLKMLMLQNNAKKGSFFNYEIMFANGLWYAWYISDSDDMLRDEVNKLGNSR